ncbi:hypothetical protein JXB31_04845 [Candidatus Woesearchaeota archaeon]|nr:hypothetical protein [Candidatus Woesearchaeota archaeon]
MDTYPTNLITTRPKNISINEELRRYSRFIEAGYDLATYDIWHLLNPKQKPYKDTKEKLSILRQTLRKSKSILYSDINPVDIGTIDSPRDPKLIREELLERGYVFQAAESSVIKEVISVLKERTNRQLNRQTPLQITEPQSTYIGIIIDHGKRTNTDFSEYGLKPVSYRFFTSQTNKGDFEGIGFYDSYLGRTIVSWKYGKDVHADLTGIEDNVSKIYAKWENGIFHEGNYGNIKDMQEKLSYLASFPWYKKAAATPDKKQEFLRHGTKEYLDTKLFHHEPMHIRIKSNSYKENVYEEMIALVSETVEPTILPFLNASLNSRFGGELHKDAAKLFLGLYEDVGCTLEKIVSTDPNDMQEILSRIKSYNKKAYEKLLKC